MNPLDLISGLGPIFALAMLLAVIVALVMCGRADSPRTVRRALIASFVPFVLGVLSAPVGIAVLLGDGGNKPIPWFILGKNCLAGLVITLPPLIWALMLMRSRGRPATVATDN